MAEPDKTLRAFGGRKRCAIYTRKSSEEGLEQAFNSLDAQREACAAFILSQKHEGWIVVPTLYDDGGFSGGSMERPALKRLIADIEAGKVDVIVVYKVDRLTRALSDFAKLVEVFDRRGASFVSITQQFNTTTSMGRLTLNVLLSFAQFEREVTGERIRDKIAASKRKGMWMGGCPPLGYDVKDRRLVPNPDEARTVVYIFRRYLEIKSVRALQSELDAAEIRSKRRIRGDGSEYGGRTLSRGALYLMLQNRLYRGEISHKGSSYPGEHPPIVEQSLWDNVHGVLAENRVHRATGANATQPSLLVGMVFDESGERLTPTHAVKKGTRYRYYVSNSLITGPVSRPSNGRRIPAGNLEGLVINRLRTFFCDEGAILEAIQDDCTDANRQRQMIDRGGCIAAELGGQAPDRTKPILMELLSRVDVQSNRVEISVYLRHLIDLLAGHAIHSTRSQTSGDECTDLIILTVPARLQRVGREMRMLVENSDDERSADRGLLRVIARAFDIQTRLSANTGLSVHDAAFEERVSAAYVYSLLRLSSLAPTIVTAIISGRNPPQLTAKKLMRLAPGLPIDWTEQRKLLGFNSAG